MACFVSKEKYVLLFVILHERMYSPVMSSSWRVIGKTEDGMDVEIGDSGLALLVY